MKERLQKIIARAGITSRRKAEELIESGQVTVNGKIITELGTGADPEQDYIKVRGKLIRPEQFEYYLVNKPKGMLSSVSDPEGRPCVSQIVRSSKRLYPAGRLDFNSEGLLILTNDGDLTKRLLEGKIDKVYNVKVQRQPTDDEIQRLVRGLTIDGLVMRAEKVRLLRSDNNTWYEVVLRQGKNRQIRKMFERIGHPVLKLRRVAIGKIKLGRLSPGEYRELSPAEVTALKGKGRGE